MSISDEQLIAQYQKTRASADLDELFERHLSTVRNLAYRLVLSNSVADDITQEVFIKVLRSVHRFRGEAKFSTWLYQVTLNTTKAYFRKQDKKLETPGYEVNEQPNTNSSPERQVMHVELVDEVDRALAKLSTKLRAAIVLTSIEQIPVKEAATIEGCTAATMHWRVHHARKQLKQHLNRYLKT